MKDAICDEMRDAGRGKPLPPESGRHADLPLFVSCFQVLSRNTTMLSNTEKFKFNSSQLRSNSSQLKFN